MEHREASRAGPAEAAAPRRFARFVTGPTPRRLALTRLGLAGLALSLVVWLSASAVDALAAWVRSQSSYRLAFREIGLDPPPPPWFRGEAPAFLDRVRADANIPSESLSALDCDLEQLRREFKLCVWVKEVTRIRRGHPNKLVASLEYRIPVAEVVVENGHDWLIDGDAVLLPREDVDREALGPRIAIHGLAPPYDAKPGKVWKTTDGQDRPDERARAAVQLVGFLTRAQAEMGTDAKVPQVELIYATDENAWFVRCAGPTWILWGDPADEAKPNRLTAKAKWNLIVDWFQKKGTQVVIDPDYLDFSQSRIVVRQGRREKRAGPEAKDRSGGSTGSVSRYW